MVTKLGGVQSLKMCMCFFVGARWPQNLVVQILKLCEVFVVHNGYKKWRAMLECCVMFQWYILLG
jgi:hypothetical protein